MKLLLVLFIIYSTGCTQKAEQREGRTPTPLDTTAVIAEGQKIKQAAFSTLSSNLQQALSEGGVSHALTFCNVQAIPLTDSLSEKHDVTIRRVSHRPRNSINRADSLELTTIKNYLEQVKRQQELKPHIHTNAERTIYHAPIRINNPLCLNCHGNVGTNITQSDLRTIQELYPNDEATGFEMGELRGLWVIDFPTSYFK